MITVVAKKEFFIRATGLLPNIIYYELLKLIYAYINCRGTLKIRTMTLKFETMTLKFEAFYLVCISL